MLYYNITRYLITQVFIVLWNFLVTLSVYFQCPLFSNQCFTCCNYVLTRNRKAEAEVILETKDTYTVWSQITATVSPMDHVDADTSASSD